MALERWRPFSSLERWEEPWDPFRMLSQMQREMNRLFEGFGGRMLEPASMREWYPPLDVAETKDEMVVRAEIPGMKPSDINVSIADNTLLIEGERKQEEETKGENYYRRERMYGAFRRAVPLPTGIQADQIKASYRDGILEVRLPKPEEAKAKQVKVNVESKAQGQAQKAAGSTASQSKEA